MTAKTPNKNTGEIKEIQGTYRATHPRFECSSTAKLVPIMNANTINQTDNPVKNVIHLLEYEPTPNNPVKNVMNIYAAANPKDKASYNMYNLNCFALRSTAIP